MLRELKSRVGYLDEVGLGYLTVERQARTLSGGEAQRIHLASALGSLLTATMYALDEPTVGLHAGDVRRLLGVLRHLRDLGNTVVVVEHDPMMIAGADFTVELGPGGGRDGGSLIRAGAPARSRAAKGAKNAKNASAGTPGRVILLRTLSRERRFTRRDPALRIVGAREHNLKGLDVRIPLGRMVCVTGVSGSGKSTLVEDVLYNNYLRQRGEPVSEVGACDRIEGLELVGEMVHMGQELPARSLRSNPATYLKIYDDIRRLFAQSNEARRLGIQPRHFSFNVDGGRCEKCHGTGTVTIEMHFMADLEVQCDACDGRRFQSHILAIRYQGRNVNEVLGLTVDEARGFFAKSLGGHAPARGAERGRPGLPVPGPGDFDAFRRRGAAPQARAFPARRSRTAAGGAGRQAAGARFSARRADHGAELRRHPPTPARARAAGGRGQHAGGDRASSRVHRARGLRHRPRSGRRRRRRARGGGGSAAEGRGGGAFADRARVAPCCSDCRPARRAPRRVRPSCARAPDDVSARADRIAARRGSASPTSSSSRS